MIRRVLTSLFFLFAFVMIAQAQVGYQVSLLNTATGEPRANVTVNAQVTITDSQNKTIYNGTQKATSNDFGVLSLTVGDANTFAEAGTSKWPLFISVIVDGTLIGKSQILSVPVAEVANSVKSSFTKEDLIGTWNGAYEWGDNCQECFTYRFKENGEVEHTYFNQCGIIDTYTQKGEYEISGNSVFIYVKSRNTNFRKLSQVELSWYKSKLYRNDLEFTKE